MSIHTNALPKNSDIRVENEPRKVVSVPPQGSAKDAVEIELNVPVVLFFLIMLGIVIYGGYTFIKNGGSITGTTQRAPEVLADSLVDITLPLKDIALKGDVKTPYIFVEFSDFECPFCKQFSAGINASTLKKAAVSDYQQIVATYVTNSKIRYGYAPYILATQHNPAAMNESVAYFCANDQGKGFEYQEAIFMSTNANGFGLDKQGSTKETLLTVAQGLGLDGAKFASCYDKRDVARVDELKSRIEEAVRKPWGAKYGDQFFGTPAFAICKISATNPAECQGKAFVGAWPFADIKGVIDTYLEAQLAPTATAAPKPTTNK